jgi:hypothetical protein
MRLIGIGRNGLLLLLVSLLLAACWGDEEATPTADPAAAAPVSALPTAAASDTTPDTAAPTHTTTETDAPETNAEATPAGIAALATPQADGATPTSASTDPTTTTAPATSPTPTFVPLEAEESDNCEVESNLDLAGYPNLEQRMGCAVEPAIFDPIAINEFGPADQPTDRFMLWFSHETMIYVLLPDGTYETHEDTWDEATDPTYPCNPVGGEEDSPPLPRRGFGKLWCSSPELQEILGTVPREERLCQYAVLQRFELGRLLACFEDATIRYFRILDDGTWDLHTQ